MIKGLSHMWHWSTQFTGHSHLHPEHCIYYGSLTNFPQPNVRSVIPDLGTTSNFNLHHMPEPHDSAQLYGITQYNGVQHQHPVSDLNLAVAASTGPYYPYMAPPSGIRDISVPVNNGAHNQLSLASTQRIIGIPTVSYGSNIAYMDGIRGSLNRKNAEGVPVNCQYHNVSAGSSFSVAPMTARPAEHDVASLNGTFQPPELGSNEPMTSMSKNEFQRSVRNRSGIILPEPVLANNVSHLIQGSYFPLPVQVPGTFVWTQAPSILYMPGSVNGARVEAGNAGIQGYQVTAGSTNASSSHPSIPQGHPNLHYLPLPIQGIGGHNINFPSQVATSSNRISTSSNTNNSPYQGVIDAELLAPVPPTGFQLYQPQRREVILDPNAWHQNLPNLRLLPEDEMAMLNIPGYLEAGVFIDQHQDMRLDVDRMTYEELLVLEEQIGIVGTGLSEDDIQTNLKTRTFSSLARCLNHKKAAQVDQQSNFCVICQVDFQDQENVGTLNCGHEYHVDCIKKWLVMKNTCPICKSKALK